MELAQRSKKKRFILAIIALGCAIIGTALMATSTLLLIYPLLWCMIPVTAFGYYGMAFFFPAHGRMKDYIKVVNAVENEGLRSYKDISDAVLLKEKYLQKCLTKCVGRRYLTRYALGTDGVIEV